MKRGIIILFCLVFLSIFVYSLTVSDSNSGNFNQGTYLNTTHNGTAVVLNNSNTSGTYISRIFDASGQALWNNFSITRSIPAKENIFIVDGLADIWRANDSGLNWTKVNDDYNGVDGNGATDMSINSSRSLFILDGQDLWKSDNFGVTWTKINEDYNGAEGQNGAVFSVDKS
ncbi:MAG: hypothetical protein AABY22_26525, partial [Nanoarchaeota archaeon]